MQEVDDRTRLVAAPPAADDATRLVTPTAAPAATTPPPIPSASAPAAAAPAQPAQPATATATASTDAEGRRIIKQRFVLEKVLGSGGMGSVFKAIDLRKQEANDRDPYVAIKLLNEDFQRHPDSFISLQREARKSQTLAHPNIVTVFDFDRDRDMVFMTMELLTGEPLDQLLRKHSGRGLPREQALSILRDMGAGLSYAHSHQIAHSDFKPGNVFVTAKGVAKVLDFGIARAVSGLGEGGGGGEQTLFDPGSLGALTPTYASLEMLRGETPDPRDDVYALGCVAYELFAGEHPYQRKTAEQALTEKLKPRRIDGLSRVQWRALEQALAFERAQRLPTVDALLEAFGEQRSSKLWLGVATLTLAAGIGAASYFYFNQPAAVQPDMTSLRADVESEVKLKIAADEIGRRLQDLRFEAGWLDDFDTLLKEYLQVAPADDLQPAQWRAQIGDRFRAEVTRRREAGDLQQAQTLLQLLQRWAGDAANVGEEQQLIAAALERQQAAAATALQKQQELEQQRQQQIAQQRAQEQQAATIAAAQQAVVQAENDWRAALQCRGGLNTTQLQQRWQALGKLDTARQQGLAAEFGKQVAACAGALSSSDPAAAEQLLRWGRGLLPNDSALAAVKVDPCAVLPPGSGGRAAQNVCSDTLSGGGRGPRLVVAPAAAGGTPFAIAKFETSGDEFAAFCRGSGSCDGSRFKGNQPAQNLDGALAEKYAAWLSKMSGFRYRLPSRSEWQHAASGGGGAPDPNRNCVVNAMGLTRGGFAVPVTTGRANGWGLINAAGNVAELVKNGGSYGAAGGSYNDPIDKCGYDTLTAAADGATGLRLLRELAR